jgi:hypothetical protein
VIKRSTNATRRKPRFTALEAVLLLGVGFAIRPAVDAIAAHAFTQIAAALAYFAVAAWRVWPRLPSLPKTDAWETEEEQ